MNPERFIERILETENLTSELKDRQAQRLLDWGIARVRGLVEGIQDAEAAGERVNGLMALMRGLNRLAPLAAGGDPASLAAGLARLDELARVLYPRLSPRDSQALSSAAGQLAALEEDAAFEFLLAWPLQGQESNLD